MNADLPDRLLTQREAAEYLAVSARYLRESSCPKVLLPGHGKKGHPLVRYSLRDLHDWRAQWATNRRRAS